MRGEKNLERETYLPLPHDLHRRITASFEGEEYAGRGFESSAGALNRFISHAKKKLFQQVESFTGPLYQIRSKAERLNEPWEYVLDILYKQGLIKNPAILFSPPYNDEPKFYVLYLESNISQEKLVHSHIKYIENGGFSFFDYHEAVSKTIGELLERYTLSPLSTYSYERFSISELRHKRKRFLDPERMCVFSEDQRKQHADFYQHGDASFLWVEGKNLYTEEPILLPAQNAFWGYNPTHAGEPWIQETNSNGCAGMFTKESAIVGGLRELIERDAFLLYWLNTIAPPRVELATLEDSSLQELFFAAHRYDLEVEILDTTSDIRIPSFTAVVIDKAHCNAGEAAITMGGGCNFSPEQAIRSALTEALAARGISRWNTKAKEEYFIGDEYVPFIDKNLGRNERVSLWMNKKMFPKFKWFLEGEEVSFQSVKDKCQSSMSVRKEDQLLFLLKRFRELGFGNDIYYFQAKHKALDALGYYAVKVIIPGLVPLYLAEWLAPLGVQRLQQFFAAQGATRSAFPNPFPHPYP